MGEIKAIETVYDGYRFRSRLEARVAVMLKSMNVRYEYEKEGYKLPDCTYYLPDFYLPDFDTHIEAKANTYEGWSDVEYICRKSIQWGGPIKRIIIITEIPNPHSEDKGLWHFPVLFSFDAIRVRHGWWYFEDDLDGKKTVTGKVSDDSSVSLMHHSSWSMDMSPKTENQLFKHSYDEEPFVAFNCDFTYAAYAKARQARFEHGESPL